MSNDLAIAKQRNLQDARRIYRQTSRAITVEISVRSDAGWQHYVYQYNPTSDSLIQDKHE